MAVFFRANAYYQIKIDKEMTKPDSPEFLNLDELEKKGYEEAKELRREILHEVSFMVDFHNIAWKQVSRFKIIWFLESISNPYLTGYMFIR